MVLGWRRAFCTSISNRSSSDGEKQQAADYTNPTPKLSSSSSSKFATFFSSSNTATATPISPKTTPVVGVGAETPKLHCKTTKYHHTTTSHTPPTTNNTTPGFFHSSNPSSPRSPSTFSFLKSTRLRLPKARCGICLQRVKAGQGTAIFTAECNHSFHFPCVAAHVRKQAALACPVCSSAWKELPLLSIHNVDTQTTRPPENLPSSPKIIHVDPNYNNSSSSSNLSLKVYNDDEPLMSSSTSGTRRWFNPIPESDEENENTAHELQGFFMTVNANATAAAAGNTTPNAVLDFRLLPEVAIISVGRSSETRTIVLKVKAPTTKAARKAPIDLVTVLDVSGNMSSDKLQLMKKAMRLVVSSLSAADRLSIVAFSTASKRLLALKRMTTAGRRSARRIVDAIVALDGTGGSTSHALKKAVKVLEDRRERNLAASIILISDGHGDRFPAIDQKRQPLVWSTRFHPLGIAVHSIALGQASAYEHARSEDWLAKSIGGLVSVVVQDLTVRLGCISGAAPAEIAGVYSYAGRPTALGCCPIRLGELYAEEERELLVELKVASSAIGAHHVLSVRCSFKDPSTQELVNHGEQALLVPRPTTSQPQRLKPLFITTRAVAEARRLVERNDLGGAHHMLASARALLLQSGLASSDEFVRGLEAELSELNWKRKKKNHHRHHHQVLQQIQRRRVIVDRDALAYVEEKAEPLTPTSAWRAAERLAKLAVVRKSLTRVSDLYGFENAGF